MDLSSNNGVAHGTNGEEEIDLLNDETFGDSQEAFDWDEATKSDAGGFFGNADAESSQVELQVSQLVLEDEPDDPAIITLHARRIPVNPKGDDLSQLYGPQSPPAYLSADYLLNPTQDIWGSPAQSSPMGFLSNGSDSTSTGGYNRLRDAYRSSDRGFPAPPQPPTTMTQSQPLPLIPGDSSGSMMPKSALTLEELEQQLLQQPSSSQASQADRQSQRATIPPPGFNTTSYPTSGSPLQHLLQQPGQRPSARDSPPVSSSYYQPRMPAYQRNGQSPPVLEHGMPRQPISILQRPPLRWQGPPPHHGMSMMRGMRPGPPHPGPSGSPSSHIPPHMLQHMRMQQWGMHGGGPQQPMHRMMHPGYGPPPPPHVMYGMGMRPVFHHQPVDEYAGLLTNREREWLIKIQMIQLHTDDPYTDDYYYTIYNLEKAHRDDNSGQSHSSADDLILPAMAKLETREYKPLQFEGSLGRLTSSSVHKPRQVLDVGTREDHTTHSAHDVKKYRQTLIHIEKGYHLMLSIDECKKKSASVPEEQRLTLMESSQQKLSSLHSLVEENLSALLAVRKGRALLLRTISLLDVDKARSLLDTLLQSFSSFIKREAADPMDMKNVKCVNSVLRACDISKLVAVCSLLEPHMKSLVKTRFGCWLMIYSIQQAEKIYSAYVTMDEEDDSKWRDLVSEFVKALLKCKAVPTLSNVPLAVYDHLEQRHNATDLLTKVDGWFKKVAPA